MAEYVIQLLNLSTSWQWVIYTIVALIQCALLLVVALCSAAVFIWAGTESLGANSKTRLGPTRVGGRFGWLQPPADGIKLLCKEDIIPAAADRPLFRIAPYISFCAVFSTFIALPFANGWVAIQLNAGAFFILAVMGLEVFGVILGGYASGSKWSLYGAMREAAQVVSYEIPLALCVVVPVLICGTMDLVQIGQFQAGLGQSLAVVPRSFHILHVLDFCGLRHGQHEPRPVRSARGRERTGRGLLDRVYRLPLGDFLHGRISGDVCRHGLGVAFVPWRMEWSGARDALSRAYLGPRSDYRVARQRPGPVQFHHKNRHPRDVHDLGALGAAPASRRSGDDHLSEILRAAGFGDDGRREWFIPTASPRA